ncbi:aromatic ring-opening dioxygenase LigA [Conyzicola sp.]|uniref:aromatic ring-opening dioxygenase LigA n=1 Tax=Conyzicola sp. TaxID=1969404 RepID=UPI003989A899
MTTTTVNTTTLGITARTSTAIRVVGFLAILGGLVMIIGGGVVWGLVSGQLADENITVSDDASMMAGAPVVGPFSAYAQADIINHHALEMAEGMTYAELEQDDPIRATVMNASFLRTSLFTSVVSFGVAAFAIGSGLLVGLIGWSLTAIVPSNKRREGSA